LAARYGERPPFLTPGKFGKFGKFDVMALNWAVRTPHVRTGDHDMLHGADSWTVRSVRVTHLGTAHHECRDFAVDAAPML
jgi:hypothetical protein